MQFPPTHCHASHIQLMPGNRDLGMVLAMVIKREIPNFPKLLWPNPVYPSSKQVNNCIASNFLENCIGVRSVSPQSSSGRSTSSSTCGISQARCQIRALKHLETNTARNTGQIWGMFSVGLFYLVLQNL